MSTSGFPSLYPHSLSAPSGSGAVSSAAAAAAAAAALPPASTAPPLAPPGAALPGLTEEESAAFRAGAFTYGAIPEVEPPAALANVR